MRINYALGLGAAPTTPAGIVHHVGLARDLDRKRPVIWSKVARHLAGLAVKKFPCPGLRVREREHRDPVRVPNIIRRA